MSILVQTNDSLDFEIHKTKSEIVAGNFILIKKKMTWVVTCTQVY